MERMLPCILGFHMRDLGMKKLGNITGTSVQYGVDECLLCGWKRKMSWLVDGSGKYHWVMRPTRWNPPEQTGGK